MNHALRSLFARDITRTIPPVVYFHTQDPGRIRDEVQEYIITGGYPDGHPHKTRVPSGIHEQYVRLLRNIRRDLDSGTDLPASWISGFFGSGKSSFAKLLGLALDGLTLPDGQRLGDALVARDDSPRAHELRDAWDALAHLDSLAVVFDIGSVARSGERIHTAARRALQLRLNYSNKPAVAEYELRLERAGEWDAFLRAFEDVHQEAWHARRVDPFADELFSEAIHKLKPSTYADPLAWIDAHSGRADNHTASVEDTTADIEHMLLTRAPGKTLFFVIDEVSQYIHKDDNLMLALQSFISDLGKRLKGRVWLLATGQQKLEDEQQEGHSITKLKDRFPPHLRVHLDPTNIRDVIHKRLLQKSEDGARALHALLAPHRASLQLHALGGDALHLDELVETYPLLPTQIDLLLEITSAIRTRSARAQADAQAIRGILQLVGEIFRSSGIQDEAPGALITLDHVYAVLHSALDHGTQNTLAALFNQRVVKNDPLAGRVVRAVALLELIQDQSRWRTSDDLIARSLYPRAGAPPHLKEIQAALKTLSDEGLLGYSEKHGYKLMSSAGQEWQLMRDRLPVTEDDRKSAAIELLGAHLQDAPLVKHKKHPFPWHGLFSDERRLQGHTVRRAPSNAPALTVHFYWFTDETRRQLTLWLAQSKQKPHELHWFIHKELDLLSDALSDLLRSRAMLAQHEARFSSLPDEKKILFYEEKSRADTLAARARDAIAQAFLRGTLLLDGGNLDTHIGRPFKDALEAIAAQALPRLYHAFIEYTPSENELRQLLPREPAGVSALLLRGGLGILAQDGGRYTAPCDGAAPQAVLRFIQDQQRTTGADLLQRFTGPPWGYTAELLRAALLGLLRAGQIVALLESGARATSTLDPGVEDLLVRSKGFPRATFSPATEGAIDPRQRKALAIFFKKTFQTEPQLENEALADAVFQHVPDLRRRLNALRDQTRDLPVNLPPALDRLQTALDHAAASRQIEPTVRAAIQVLNDLQDGIEALQSLDAALTPEVGQRLQTARQLTNIHAPQLTEIDAHHPVQDSIDALHDILQSPEPWTRADELLAHNEAITIHYQTQRDDLVKDHFRDLERALAKLPQHEGYARLNPSQVSTLKLKVERAAFDTTNNQLHPSLLTLRDAGPPRLQAALEEALKTLDASLLPAGAQIVHVSLQHLLPAQPLRTRDDIEDLLTDLRRHLMEQLQPHVHLRLR